jgi:serine/threonine-protein kinase PpkA
MQAMRLFAITFAGLLGLLVWPVAAAVQEPMLMDGKRSLYVRVLAAPDATLRQAPKEDAPGQAVVPFTVYYVYERQSGDGGEWLRVGTDSHGTLDGWLSADEAIEWNQALTVAFRDPRDQGRVLLFKDRDALQELVQSGDEGARQYHELYEEAVEGQGAEDSPVIAIQPSNYVDLREDFYLVPIKQHQDVFLGSEQARMLKVASVPLDGDSDVRVQGLRTPSYRSGLVFVVDSTVSMRPYIDRTRDVMRRVYASIDEAGLTDKVNFGLTAYRDNTQSVPDLKYLTKTFVTLEEGGNARRFLTAIDELWTAWVSSQDFREDAYAGVKYALETNDWRGFDARYIVLITDAGARDAGDPLSGTGMQAKALRQLAYDKGVSIWVLHLLTPEGSEDHAQAEHQYRVLSEYPGIGQFYYGVPMGDVAEFGTVLEALTRQITEQVRATVSGAPPLPIPEGDRPDTQLAGFQHQVAKLGYALRMRYLQRGQNETVPKVFDAWLVDRDFDNPQRATLDVNVLLTRDQLSDLQYVLRRVLDTAEEGVLSPSGFLDDLKSMAATLTRDPASVGKSTRAAGSENLADLGYMREYIEDLPYQGEVMSISLQDWEDWSAKRQFEFVNGLESKIRYYQALHDHTDLWTSLDGGPVDGDSVYPVRLDMLP